MNKVSQQGLIDLQSYLQQHIHYSYKQFTFEELCSVDETSTSTTFFQQNKATEHTYAKVQFVFRFNLNDEILHNWALSLRVDVISSLKRASSAVSLTILADVGNFGTTDE